MNKNRKLQFIIAFVCAAVFAAAAAFCEERTAQDYKDAIFNTYGIKVYDYADIGARSWPEEYLKAMIEVFRDLPADFTSCTRMIYMDPSVEQFEIKYDGYNEEFGIVQVGYAYKNPSPAYKVKFKKLYGALPTADDYLINFKTMLVRGMTYCYIQEKTDDWGKSEVLTKYQIVYASDPTFPTYLFIPADENYMVVAPGKNHLWTDLAFAVAKYCTDAAGLKSKYPERYEFVKEHIFDGAGVDGWGHKWLDGSGATSGGDGHTGDYAEPKFADDTDTSDDTSTTTETNTDTGTNTDTSSETETNSDTETATDTSTATETSETTDTSTNTETSTTTETDTSTNTETSAATDTSTTTETSTTTDTSTSTETNTTTETDTSTSTSTDTSTDTSGVVAVEDREDIPTIPEGKYYPVVSNIGISDTSPAFTDNSEWLDMPEKMKIAIKELFDELPKYFSTCTQSIGYVATSDTADAFSSEGYIFVTNNSWFAPSYEALTDKQKKSRFKQILVREMAKTFLYYHGSKITRWRATFGTEISDIDAKTDIVESTVLYYTDATYLEKLHSLKWSFIKNNIFSETK